MTLEGLSGVSGNPDTRYKFTEKERNVETGLDYFGARYYDSRIGRFHAIDPLKDKFPALSPFIYSNGNPMRFIDPTGMAAIDLVFDGSPTDQRKNGEEGSGEAAKRQADGAIVSLAFSASWAFGDKGRNLEMGLAFNLRTGSAFTFEKQGPSSGLGAGFGLEAAVQEGPLDLFADPEVQQKEQNTGEIELAGEALSISITTAPSHDGFGVPPRVGYGVAGGLGGGVNINRTSYVRTSPVINLIDVVRLLRVTPNAHSVW